MKRRDFLISSVLAGVSVGISSCQTQKADNQLEQGFLDDFELNEITVAELQQKMSNGELSSRQIVEMYLKRIKELDQMGPKTSAIPKQTPNAPI